MSPTEKEHSSRFDAMAEAFDAWFAKNANVFESELLAEKHFLTDPENTVSIGCGTDVKIGSAEDVPYGDEQFNGVLLGTILIERIRRSNPCSYWTSTIDDCWEYCRELQSKKKGAGDLPSQPLPLLLYLAPPG